MKSHVARFVEFEGETALLIPDEILESLGWGVGDELNMEAQPQKLILTLVRKAQAAVD